jgi:hypothetical protein
MQRDALRNHHASIVVDHPLLPPGPTHVKPCIHGNAMRGVRTHASRNGVVRLIRYLSPKYRPKSRYPIGTYCADEFRASCKHCDHLCVEGQDSPGVQRKDVSIIIPTEGYQHSPLMGVIP